MLDIPSISGARVSVVRHSWGHVIHHFVMVATLKMCNMINYLMELVLIMNLDHKIVMIVDGIGPYLLPCQILWIANCMGQIVSSCAALCRVHKVHGPHFAWAAKCMGMHRTPSVQQTRRVRGPWFNCVGCTECAGSSCVGYWVGRTVHAPSSHLPHYAHARKPQFHAHGLHWATIAQHVKG